LVVFGQGETANRSSTLLRMSDRLREELAEVAQGQLYLVIEVALRRLIDELKALPPGSMQVINAADIKAEPARAGRPPIRAPRARKTAAPARKAAAKKG
jgi:hypothetical protein